MILMIALQAILLAVMIFVPFGFDHPSSWGLDFGHLMYGLGLYTLALILGIIFAIRLRKRILALVQVGPLILVALFFVYSVLASGHRMSQPDQAVTEPEVAQTKPVETK